MVFKYSSMQNINDIRKEAKFHINTYILEKKNFFKEILFSKFKSFQYLYDMYQNKKLKESYSINNCLNLRGGGKKRKKKTYTKPKKIKHVRKKIKLKVLKYYKIENGKIKKMKKESPNSPGCFMAEHLDRLTCGKTGLTLVRKN